MLYDEISGCGGVILLITSEQHLEIHLKNRNKPGSIVWYVSLADLKEINLWDRF